jgi:hypothetical protein
MLLDRIADEADANVLELLVSNDIKYVVTVLAIRSDSAADDALALI